MSRYYSKDSGETWAKMKGVGETGGRGVITKIGQTYRFFPTTETDIYYSDYFGDTWSKSKGLVGSK